MNKNKCLFCYRELESNNSEFHESCSKKIFGTSTAPILDYNFDQMSELAQKVVESQSTVTGVQAKISLGINKEIETKKMTIMGVFGGYILKPPSRHYPNLPEIEDLTMHLAEIAGIKTVPHTLIRLASGELSYLTKRIDRDGKKKYHMEDMCQLTERLTEAKYRGSYEQIGRAIIKYSVNPGIDIIDFYEQVVFSFLSGNNDMHMKNFSLFKDPRLGYKLSPAYDLLAAELVVEGDDEELALTLNGKKRKINRKDFEISMSNFNIDQQAFDNIFTRLLNALPEWHKFIEISFLPSELKNDYKAMIDRKARQIGLA